MSHRFSTYKTRTGAELFLPFCFVKFAIASGILKSANNKETSKGSLKEEEQWQLNSKRTKNYSHSPYTLFLFFYFLFFQCTSKTSKYVVFLFSEYSFFNLIPLAQWVKQFSSSIVGQHLVC